MTNKSPLTKAVQIICTLYGRCFSQKNRSPFFIWIINFLLIICLQFNTSISLASERWSPPANIPGFEGETLTPQLIADRNGTVHAFASQQFDSNRNETAIIYSIWTLETGWTFPVDIVLSPLKNDARLLGAFLDEAGLMHLLFFGGDDTEANVYYTQAPAVDAGRASAWSKPIVIGERAITPENGALSGDGNGNLIAIYSGDIAGHGFYYTLSQNSGQTWSEPAPFFLTYDNELWPYYLKLSRGASGWLQAVWTANDISNHGVALYYARFSFSDMRWSDLVTLAETEGGLGTQAPAIIEYQGDLLVMYYTGHTGKQNFIISTDNGYTWSEPVAPFPHVGLNDSGFFVTDSADNLHFFWGQRLTGSPDIHGMWQSTWQNGQWSDAEAVVSGPRISDEVGNRAFDPVLPRAVCSQGNILLVAWISDYGLKGNGVWYSFKVIDTPALPRVPLPDVKTEGVEDVDNAQTPLTTHEAEPEPLLATRGEFVNPASPSDLIVISVSFSALFILLIILSKVVSRQRQ